MLKVEPLFAALKDRDSSVRQNAAEALVKIGSPAVKPLIVALKDSEWFVCSSAAEALGKIGDSRAVEPLIAALKDSAWSVRSSAAEALGKIGDKMAVEPLIAALKDRNSSVRQNVAEALRNIGWNPDKGESEVAYWIALRKWDECIKIGSSAIEPIVAMLRDFEGNVRCEAAYALGKIGDKRAVEPLVAVLDADYYSEHMKVHEALVKIGSPAVEPLIVALKDRNSTERMRFRAVKALEDIGLDKRAVEPLIVALEDDDYYMHREAVNALVKIGSSAVEPLIIALKDDDELQSFIDHNWSKELAVLDDGNSWLGVAMWHIAALKRGENIEEMCWKTLNGMSASDMRFPFITSLRKFNNSVRRSARMRRGAAEVLGIIGDKRAVEPFIAALKDSSCDVRMKAASALGDFGDRRAVEPLIAALKDSHKYVRQNVAYALEKIGDRRAVEPLIAAKDVDEDEDVRKYAAEALDKIHLKPV